jgi:hypothetical protein
VVVAGGAVEVSPVVGAGAGAGLTVIGLVAGESLVMGA